MNKAKYISRSVSDAKVATQVNTALNDLEGNKYFPIDLGDLETKRDAYIAALNEAVYGNRAQKGVKNTAKRAVVNAAKLVCDQVNVIAAGDRDKLLTCGFELGDAVAEKKTMEPLKGFKLFNGQSLGEVVAKALKGSGTKYVLIEYAVSDTVEAIKDWSACPASRATCTISGLVSGSRVWVRATSVGPRDQKLMATPISTIVL